jgi:hypothetical protein
MIPAAVVCGAAQTKVFRILADLNHRILYITCFRSPPKKSVTPAILNLKTGRENIGLCVN